MEKVEASGYGTLLNIQYSRSWVHSAYFQCCSISFETMYLAESGNLFSGGCTSTRLLFCMAARLQSFCLNEKLEINREGRDQFQRCAELGKSDPCCGDLPTWPRCFLKLSREQGSYQSLPGYIHCSCTQKCNKSGSRQDTGRKQQCLIRTDSI